MYHIGHFILNDYKGITMEFSADHLRQQNRKRRAELSKSALEEAALLLLDRISALPEFINANKIAAYSAINGEISLNPVIDLALELGKQVYLPNLDLKSLRFSPYFHDQKMRINRFKLPEPDVTEAEMLAPEALDLVLAPLVAFDPQRNRIGMGGGYYDRSFEFRKQAGCHVPILIGVAHELQKVDELVPEEWDVRLDMVMTDVATYK
ncbi:MAG: 5-formyltetrahydrofolate cyclo-ligase [Gammaproteobacteria bacterium]|jgi:5-formyltetrahydrofolate cyclo-ligase